MLWICCHLAFYIRTSGIDPDLHMFRAYNQLKPQVNPQIGNKPMWIPFLCRCILVSGQNRLQCRGYAFGYKERPTDVNVFVHSLPGLF